MVVLHMHYKLPNRWGHSCPVALWAYLLQLSFAICPWGQPEGASEQWDGQLAKACNGRIPLSDTNDLVFAGFILDVFVSITPRWWIHYPIFATYSVFGVFVAIWRLRLLNYMDIARTQTSATQKHNYKHKGLSNNRLFSKFKMSGYFFDMP